MTPRERRLRMVAELVDITNSLDTTATELRALAQGAEALGFSALQSELQVHATVNHALKDRIVSIRRELENDRNDS